jgi:hypothetical protein
MTVALIGMIHHRHASELHPPVNLLLDPHYICDFAQAFEGDGIVLPASSSQAGKH